MRVAFVYEILCVENGKRYIGRSSNYNGRIASHFQKLKKRSHHCYALQADYDSIGEAAFRCSIIATVPEELGEAEEIKLIKAVPIHHIYNQNHVDWRSCLQPPKFTVQDAEAAIIPVAKVANILGITRQGVHFKVNNEQGFPKSVKLWGWFTVFQRDEFNKWLETHRPDLMSQHPV